MNHTLESRKIENFILHTFHGRYVNPKRLNSWHSEKLFKLFEEREGKESSRLVSSPLSLPFTRTRVKETNMNQPIGTMKPNSKFKEKGSYDLQLTIPFETATTFWIQPVKKDENTKPNSPEFDVFFGGLKFGAIWKKTSEKNGKDYFSATVWRLGKEPLNFNLFPKETNEGIAIPDTYQAVFWTPDEPKEENISHEPT